ncbi:sodium- and chloride-dependent glycine transporter 1-like [Babylonia areolata]|uniref:sodium- and chloride-dependent glycine transporter 1-like n=1 Tax=Babylonia areolata TaxID=304850 RepID=UPI003FD65EB4
MDPPKKNGAYYAGAGDAEAGKVTVVTNEGDENADRGNWSRKLDFFLSCLSYAVGLGNVWRFPYICARNGGGAFLIPFLMMLFITGIPLVFMELSFGQFASSGVVSIWNACPLFQGVGWAMFIVSSLIAVYYNMIIAWTLYYFFASFAKTLPWSVCGPWSSEGCLEDRSGISNCTQFGGLWYNNSCVTNATVGVQRFLEIQNASNTSVLDHHSPSDDFFHTVVLDITKGVEEMGGVRWQLALCLLLAWVLVSVCLVKGIKTSGKAVYFTAFFPYVVLTILLIRGLTLKGSVDGIVYFLLPQWDQLLNAKVWGDAAVQIFFSLSPCWGGLITLASYNKFHNNCLLDSVLVSVMDCLTSVFAGLVIFSIIGYMAHQLGVSVKDVATEGAGLAFVVYPEVVTKLPISQLWAVLFFAMLITLGLGTQIATVTTVHTTLLDQFPHLFRKGRRSILLLVGIAVTCYLIGLAFCTKGGMYVLQLFDNYAATYSLLFIGLVECVVLAWVYGTERFFDDIQLMLGKRPGKIWAISWKYVAPIALTVILIFTCVNFNATKYGDYVFPGWADGVGLLLTLSSILAIPGVALLKVVMEMRRSGGSFLQSARKLTKPLPEWGPALKEHRIQRAAVAGAEPSAFESQVPLTLATLSGSNGNGVPPDGKI